MSFQLKLAWRYLAGRKLRTVLTTLAIVLGVTLLFGMNGLLPAVEGSFRQNVLAATNQVDLTITSEARGVFDAAVVEVVRNTPGVAEATGSLTRLVVLPPEYALPTQDNQQVNTVMLTGLDPSSAAEVRPLTLAEGRFLQPGDGQVLLISENLAQRAGLGLGGTMALPSSSGLAVLEIVGLVAGRPSLGAEAVYVPLPAAQELLNLPGEINTVEALFAPDSDAEIVRQTVLERLGAGYRLGGQEVGGDLLASLELANLVFTTFGVLSLAMGAFIIFNTFRTVVVERRRDIGMLRAVGASRRTILGLIVTESLLQGVIGTAAGLAVGYLLAVGVVKGMAPMWEERLHFSIGDPAFSAATWIMSIALGIGMPLLSGLYPALSASLVTPLEALRPSVAGVAGGANRRRVLWAVALIALSLLGLVSGNLGLSALGMVLFLVGLVVIGPLLIQPISNVFGRLLDMAFAREGHIARGNLARQPGRAAVTASAMTIGLAVVLGMIGMVGSLLYGIMGEVDTSLGADYLVVPQSFVLGSGNVGADPRLAQGISDTPGIAAVTTLRASPSEANGADVQVVAIDPSTYPEVAGLVFTDGDPAQAYADLGQGRFLIANGVFAAQNGIEVGDELTLQTPEGPQAYRVAAIGVDFMNLKLATVYVSQANLADDFHETSDLMILANQATDADPAAVRAALEHLVKPYPAFSLFSFKEYRQSLMSDTNAKMSIFYVVVGFLAAPSLLALANTLGINVIERTREIGMLRAVGATRGQVRRIILAESLLLAATGIAFGLLAGVWLSYVLVAGLDLAGYPLDYFFPYLGIVVTVAVGLLLGVLAALVPARQAARLEIVAALQYE